MDHPLPPTREILEHTSILRKGLYRWSPPEGTAILILVRPLKGSRSLWQYRDCTQGGKEFHWG